MTAIDKVDTAVNLEPAQRETRYRTPVDGTVAALVNWLTRIWVAHKADVVALGTLFSLVGTGLWLRWVYDNWLGEFDILTMFIPWFGYIGDRLAAGEIPGWSPHYFGGAPVAGNPSGGWMYLQVMLLYAVFPILTATKMLLTTHAIISALAVYGFSRRIGLAAPAALMSSSIFVLGQILYGGTNYMTIATQASTWLVVGLLATEMALRSTRLPRLLGWAVLLGLALSQIFMAWPGQGIAYACIWIGGWLAYRILIDPIPELVTLADRCWQGIMVGCIAGFTMLAFGAAGIMPMLDFLAESTVPNGDYSNVVGGDYAHGTDGLISIISMLVKGNDNFQFTVPSEAFGATVMMLTILGIWRARRHYGAPFFAIMFVGALSLMTTYSPTLWVFEQLPVIGSIHAHRPSGIAWLVAIGPAMLAGAAVQKLLDADRPPLRLWHVSLLVVLLMLGLATVNSAYNWIGWWGWGAAFATIFLYALPTADLARVPVALPRSARWIAIILAGLAIVLRLGYLWSGFWFVLTLVGAVTITLLTMTDLPGFIWRWQPRLPILVCYALVGLVFVNPTGWDIYTTVQNPVTQVGGWTNSPGKEPESDWVINTTMLRQDPGSAAEFLQQQEALRGPFRYTGFSNQGEIGPWTGQDNEGHKSAYAWRRMEPGVVGILVNGRTYRLGLYQTGGYNPIQIKYYTDFVDVMNGKRQDYHWLDTFVPALDGSQLLDILNVRYILVDKSIPDYRSSFKAIDDAHEVVFEDDLTLVYENKSAFPHAWIVHELRDNGNGFGLRMLASGQVDGHDVAFINTDGEFPAVAPVAESASPDSVAVISYEPEHVVLQAKAASDGFLVLSDAYASGWNAYVDGAKTPIYRTDHALRGVALPSGQHTVEFRYEPQSLRVGLLVTGIAGVGMIAVWLWALLDWFRRGTTIAVTPDSASPDSGAVRDETRATGGKRRRLLDRIGHFTRSTGKA